MLNIPVRFDDLLILIDQLTAEQKQLLRARLEVDKSAPPAPKQRVLGMHPGAFQPAPDFDDPLPDEFWLGEDA